MMTQETYVNINDLHEQGWTISEIAAETGWHRTTISDRLKNGPPAGKSSCRVERTGRRCVPPTRT